MEAELTRPSYRALWRFFLPLVVISFSQTFTYPLVASVISHGPLEGLEFEAYVIGQQVVTFLSSIGHGLVTTGIVFATTQRGRAAFMRLNLYMALAAALCQLLASLPLAEDLIFGRFLAVENPALRAIARHSLLACIPVQMNFYVKSSSCPWNMKLPPTTYSIAVGEKRSCTVMCRWPASTAFSSGSDFR